MGIKVTLLRTSISIPDAELDLSYVRSSGPGGQNVNKVNSKAVLRWDVGASSAITPIQKVLLLDRLGSRINRDGSVILMSDRFRDQIRNREDCLDKLRDLIQGTLTPPPPRKDTKPSHSSKRKVKESKQRNSMIKKLRKKI